MYFMPVVIGKIVNLDGVLQSNLRYRFFWYLLISGTNAENVTSPQADPPLEEMSPQPGPSRVKENPEKIEELVVVDIEEFE